jgi:hypothetical protein
MSDQAIDDAIAKIMADPEFARQVYEHPEEALSGNFDLLPGEWRTISTCVNIDVQESLGEVQGFAAGSANFGAVQWTTLGQATQFKSSFDRFSTSPTIVPGRTQFGR